LPSECCSGFSVSGGFIRSLAIEEGILRITFPVPTAQGENVMVELDTAGDGVTVSFSSVDAPGATSITSATTSPPVPADFRFGDGMTAFDIRTSAVSTGPAEVCVTYPEGAFADESAIRFLHYENNQWVDVTSPGYPDTANNVLCGTVTSFSLFALVEPDSGDTAADFQRGDSNADGRLDLADAVFTLNHLFRGGEAPGCLESANANDDVLVDLSDPVFSLRCLFLGGSCPPAPYPDCGPDPESEGLGCESFPPCG
jgi:hypothetical protein